MKKVAHQFFEDDGLDYEDMLNDFDSFCDQFENRAAKAYNGGDQNNGRVIDQIERIGEDTPMESEKLNTLERTLERLANPSLMYKRPTGEDYETVAQTLDFLHNNVEGLKEDLAKLSQAV